MRHKPLA
ncbi:hypothetical protein N7499_012049 [Penicillium canescens]|nr:hypothetical protein N7499_012049 [Penicillium canescens]KAJ6181787.1 hypothetical protein N7485_000429 [Penicillium canescens]